MIIDLQKLEEGFLKLSEGYTKFLMEACAVCLDHHNHRTSVELKVEEQASIVAAVKWDIEVNEILRRSHGDMQEATEYGASALALLIAEELHGFTRAERSSKGLGFDYYLKKNGDDELDIFGNCVRLEISGILNESPNNSLDKRVIDKINQVKRSDFSGLDAHICVTEFGTPKAKYIVEEQ